MRPRRSVLLQAVVALLALATAGCVTDVDKKMMSVRESAHTTQLAFAEAAKTFIGGADTMAEKKHAFQKDRIDESWNAFVSLNTKDGVFSVPPAKLAAAITNRDTMQSDLQASQQSWREYEGKWIGAITSYITMVEALYNQEVSAEQAKETITAALQAAVGAAGGMMTSLGITLPILVH